MNFIVLTASHSGLPRELSLNKTTIVNEAERPTLDENVCLSPRLVCDHNSVGVNKISEKRGIIGRLKDSPILPSPPPPFPLVLWEYGNMGKNGY